MSVKDELIEQLESFGEALQTLASELEEGNAEPMMVVSMQIHGERDYKKLERLMDSYLKEVDGNGGMDSERLRKV